MRKIDIGQAIGILANVGVIAGIVFLAVELRQNNDSLAAQARLGELQARTARFRLTLNNADLAEIQFKAIAGEPLTALERQRYFEFILYSFMHWRWEYEEFQSGRLADLDTALRQWRTEAGFSPHWQEVWNQTLRNRDEDFAEFVETNVFGK
jgi:hypothetical protein